MANICPKCIHVQVCKSAAEYVAGCEEFKNGKEYGCIRRGRWLVIRKTKMSRDVMCSVCHECFRVREKDYYRMDTAPHCPVCGSKMGAEG